MMRVGDWLKASKAMGQLISGTPGAMQKALLHEAHHLRRLVVEGITNQAPGGDAIKPLAKLTLATRRYQGFAGRKALIVSGELRNTVSVVSRPLRAFVGYPSSARAANGLQIARIAEQHETGHGPIIVPLTPKMQRFLGVLLRDAGILPKRKSVGSKGHAVVVLRHPARPFLMPAYRLFLKGAPERFRKLVRQHIWGAVS